MSERKSENLSVLSPFFEKLAKNLPADTAAAVTEYAKCSYRFTTLEEFEERGLENLYGATLSSWQFIQSYTGPKPKIRVYNPDLEKSGWRSQHTVIEIIQPDMPFLVDSIRMELHRLGLVVHTIHNSVLRIARDGSELTQLLAENDDGGAVESVIYLETDRKSDSAELSSIQKLLEVVLDNVHAAVADFDRMVDQAKQVSTALLDAGRPEESEFIEWMLDDHFTFLGYDEVEVTDTHLNYLPEGKLGTLSLNTEPRKSRSLESLTDAERSFLNEQRILVFAKDPEYSRVHRPAHMDRIIFKQLDDNGQVVKKLRFHGLFTSPVYTKQVMSIPVVRKRAESVLRKAGFETNSHNGKKLLQILNDLPRDEILLARGEELLDTVMGIFSLHDRRKVRLLMRKDRCNQFVTFLYYVPRDLMSTELRLKVENLLVKATNASEVEFTTTFSESVLARVHYVLRTDPTEALDFDLKSLEKDVARVSRDWRDELHEVLTESFGEEEGNNLQAAYANGFASAYREHFSPENAIYDINRLEELSDTRLVNMSFYRKLEQEQTVFRFKLFNGGEPLVLSDVIPVLENLGMRVVGEHPYDVLRSDGTRFWIHDFTLIHQGTEPVILEDVKDVFNDAFANIWFGSAENDEFNHLVIGANLSWREVAMLRAYARYCKQIRMGFSQPYIAGTLARHIHVTKLLVALFKARFEPSRNSSGKREALVGRIENSVIDALEKVDNINEDHILRRFLELMKATLRTSYYQRDEKGEFKDYFSFKLSPRDISNIPLPRPMFEVFVYSARVEGVHLRGGKVARGGLRWSDREEDFRTEVLGLVKAQQVKNSVIVPVGAKGGFVAKQLPKHSGREAMQAEGVACYKMFISSLLDITDNLVEGAVVPPVDVVRHDEDDPYFVVAADKGTATFSDIANEIAESRGFWLGDAFASGGSQGYDHKGMGITARGAWESVKLHFRELGLDTQTEEFTVIGIGDMAGDVFGNGMLLSEHIRLCAAFNHMHIFVDPDPEAAASYKERERMFALPRSSWEDYDQSLISAGGGIFSRAAKWLDISPEMQERFDIKESRLTPNDLISALLKAPVDLIWNGGIGTYVKASHESHVDVGDKANDGLRINGNQLRCRVLGEGGNLGFTQLGRIEYCANGGKSNTDFIDNAGGVDCSDHEVNIKILLNEIVAKQDMTVKQRNNLLREMTDEVSHLVLQNNYKQAQAISVSHGHALRAIDDYIRLVGRLESDGKLDRELEFMPADDVLAERKQLEQGLTRPELSVLISYVKAELKEELVDAWVTKDPYVQQEVLTAFPQRLVQDFKGEIENHRLATEIISTQLANGMINNVGITYVERIAQISGASLGDIAGAYVIARDVFGIEAIWEQIEALDNVVESALQQRMIADIIRLVRRAAYWFLRQLRPSMDVGKAVEQFKPGVQTLIGDVEQLLQGEPLALWQSNHKQLLEAGVPTELASVVAGADSLYSLLGIVQAAEVSGQSLGYVAQVHFGLGSRLDLHWFDIQVKELATHNHWESMARDGFREDLTKYLQAITVNVLTCSLNDDEGCDETRISQQIDEWLQTNKQRLERWQRLLGEIRSSNAQQDFAIFAVAIRELSEFA